MVGYEQPKILTSLSNIRKVTIKMILDKLRIIVSGGGLSLTPEYKLSPITGMMPSD